MVNGKAPQRHKPTKTLFNIKFADDKGTRKITVHIKRKFILLQMTRQNSNNIFTIVPVTIKNKKIMSSIEFLVPNPMLY